MSRDKCLLLWSERGSFLHCELHVRLISERNLNFAGGNEWERECEERERAASRMRIKSTPSCEITSSVTLYYTILINFHLKQAISVKALHSASLTPPPPYQPPPLSSVSRVFWCASHYIIIIENWVGVHENEHKISWHILFGTAAAKLCLGIKLRIYLHFQLFFLSFALSLSLSLSCRLSCDLILI